ILNGLRLGKYFDGGIMRDLKLLGGKFSMTGLGDIQLPFGIKARVGLDLGYDGDWLPEFSLENVSARLKLFDGIEDLISIGTKEKWKELMRTKVGKVPIIIPKVGRFNVDINIGVKGYAQAGVGPVWVNGKLAFEDGYEFDPCAPEVPDVRLDEARVSADLSGETVVEPVVVVGKNFGPVF